MEQRAAGGVFPADLIGRELNGAMLDRARNHHDALKPAKTGSPEWTSTSPQRRGYVVGHQPPAAFAVERADAGATVVFPNQALLSRGAARRSAH